MKFKLFALSAMLSLSVLAASAETTITTVVDGVTEARELVKMTFDGADPQTVTLYFADASTLVADMSLVSVALGYSGQSAIDDIVAGSVSRPGVWNLKGQRVAESLEGLATGVYITNGKKILVK